MILSNDFILADTDQTKRLKEICLSSSAYSCSGEIYKLLSREVLHELVKRIPNKSIKLPSDLLYGKKVITSEEKFLQVREVYHDLITCIIPLHKNMHYYLNKLLSFFLSDQYQAR